MHSPPIDGFGKSLVVAAELCEPCPFTLDKSDFPRKPNRISMSVGYGRRKSPCCHVNGALIAFDALILQTQQHSNQNSFKHLHGSARITNL